MAGIPSGGGRGNSPAGGGKKGYLHSEVGCEGFASEGRCSVLCNIWLKRQDSDIDLAIKFDGCNTVGSGQSRLIWLRPWSANGLNRSRGIVSPIKRKG